jgi:hypothetical protein
MNRFWSISQRPMGYWSLLLGSLLGIWLLFFTLLGFSSSSLRAETNSDPTGLDAIAQEYPDFPLNKLPGKRCTLCHGSDLGGAANMNDFGADLQDWFDAPGNEDKSSKNVDDMVEALKNRRGGDPDDDKFTNHEELLSGTLPAVKSVAETPSIALTFDTTPANQTVDAGEKATFQFSVKNNNKFPLRRIDITPFLGCTHESVIENLAADATSNRSVQCDVPIDATDFADIRATAVAYSQKSNSGNIESKNTVDIDVRTASLDLTLTPPPQAVRTGDPAQVAINVKNNGDLKLDVTTSVVFVPDVDVDCNQGPVALDKDASYSYPCLIPAMTEATTISLSATGVTPGGKSRNSEPKSATIEVAGLAITLTANPAVGVHLDPVTYTILMTNTSSAANVTNATIANVKLEDAANAECGLPDPITFAPEQKISHQCTVPAIRDANGQFTKRVTVAGVIEGTGQAVANSAELTIPVEPRRPEVSLEVATSTPRAVPGERAHFTVDIRNTGNVALSQLSVTAPKTANCNLALILLPRGDSHAYACSSIIQRDFVDEINGISTLSAQFTVEAQDPLGPPPQPAIQVVPIDATNWAFLPLIVNPESLVETHIDLVVDSLTVNNRGVTVLIKNVGDGTLSGAGYWVDLYINPSRVPTQTNQLARDWGDDGIIWGVSANAPALPPGGILTLRLAEPYYRPRLSAFPDLIPAQSEIYVQVDSANSSTSHGAVLEGHEIAHAPYNNISHFTLADAINTELWPEDEANSSGADTNEAGRLEEAAPRQ